MLQVTVARMFAAPDRRPSKFLAIAARLIFDFATYSAAALSVLVLAIVPALAQPAMEFRQLPMEVRDLAAETRQSCKQEDADMSFNDMQGIQVISLNGDGARDIVVDNEGLCGAHMAGANCSNRGCDLTIYKEISRSQWKLVFKEHLYEKFLAIDWKTMRLQLLIAAIFAGDPRCQPDPRKNYSSGESCNLIVTYKADRWNWNLIR